MHVWSPKHDATWVTHSMDYWRARAAVKEGRIFEALNAMGVADAGEKSYLLAEHEGRWDDLVRDFIKRHQ